MNFRKPYVNGFSDPEKWVHDKLVNIETVERAGYIPLEKRINAIIQSGQRLADYRRALYPDSDFVDDETPDFVSDEEFTVIDAKNLRSAVAESLGRVSSQKVEKNASKSTVEPVKASDTVAESKEDVSNE